MINDLIIIGGGASGLAAAICAKDLGLDVLLLEGNDRLGKKILTTGNGRCNISNEFINLLNYHSDNSGFSNYVINNFSSNDTKNFFYSIGLPLCSLDNGKMFPLSLQASSVVDLLKLATEEKNIAIELNAKVKSVQNNKNFFSLFTNDDKVFKCKNLLICTGGNSYTSTGSDGSGYSLARALGHAIISPVPSLVQLKLNHSKLKALSGIKFEGSCEIFVDNSSMKKASGEILFTDYGISGPPILQISRIASKYSSTNKVLLKLDLFPQWNNDELKEFIENHWGTFSYRSIFNSLIGVLNKKLIPIFLKECGIDDIHKPVYDLTWKERNSILNNLKHWTFEVSGTNSFKNAQVTAGGVDTKEIDNKTLQSKIVKNLYFAGEILDVDGDCGGFNLHWAWASGYIAAKSISEFTNK